MVFVGHGLVVPGHSWRIVDQRQDVFVWCEKRGGCDIPYIPAEIEPEDREATKSRA